MRLNFGAPKPPMPPPAPVPSAPPVPVAAPPPPPVAPRRSATDANASVGGNGGGLAAQLAAKSKRLNKVDDGGADLEAGSGGEAGESKRALQLDGYDSSMTVAGSNEQLKKSKPKAVRATPGPKAAKAPRERRERSGARIESGTECGGCWEGCGMLLEWNWLTRIIVWSASVFMGAGALAALVVLLFFLYFKSDLTVSLISFDNATYPSSVTYSAKYAFTHIDLCPGLQSTLLGSVFSPRCVRVYSNAQAKVDDRLFTLSSALSSPDALWTDLTSLPPSTRLAEFGITGSSVGVYTRAVVGWYRPVKYAAVVNRPATFLTPAGSLSTRSANGSADDGDFLSTHNGGLYSQANGLMNESITPAEAVVPLRNAGAAFAIQQGFAVGDGETFFRRKFALSLVIEPASLNVQGNMVPIEMDGNLIDAAGNSMLISPVILTPIVHSPGDTITRELYSLSSPFALLHLSLYIVNSQPFPSGSTLSLIPSMNISNTYGYVTPPLLDQTLVGKDGSVVVRSEGRVVVDKFSRIVQDGSSGVTEMDCRVETWGVVGGWPCPAGGMMNVTYTKVSEVVLMTV
ncbi:hypothetical protein HK101_005555 [Irineochytrium annulatum]|nr:hypothetical protein HK101_005555 [Irineochytrium annulatum]